jgi:hypothetical protein
MKLLTIDIETFPHLSYTWGLYDQNIALNQLKKSGVVACWAAKWHGEKKVHFDSVHTSTPRAMFKGISELFSEADAVIGWNSAAFDVKWLQAGILLHNLPPPQPFKQIDLLRTWRQQFKTASNKLDYAAQYLGIGRKVQTGGFDLWRDCMDGCDKAWAKMRRYNIADVRLTEAVYDRIRPWIKNHPNVGVFDGRHCCPKCGGDKLQSRGHYVTRDRRYPQFQCRTPGCFAWLYHVAGGLQEGVQRMRAAA